MKKVIVSLSVVAAMVFACNKKTPVNPSTTNSSQTKNTTPTVAARLSDAGPKAHFLHMVTGGSGAGWCGGFSANCISFEPDIVVKGSMKTSINDAATSGSASNVAAVFSSSAFASLDSDYLGSEATTKLTSGNYYLAKVNDDGTKASWIAGTTYPVTFDNMDFGFMGPYGN